MSSTPLNISTNLDIDKHQYSVACSTGDKGGTAMLNRELQVAVIGAGPVGLAAAAQLIKRGATPLILEAGGSVGASILRCGHVRIFSPWEYNIDSAARELLGRAGWSAPDGDEYPT